MARIVMACVVLAHSVVVYVGMAYIVMACVVMAYVVTACVGGPGGGANRYTLRRAEVVETARQTSSFLNKVVGAWL